MAKKIDRIREVLADDIFSMTELENIMEGFGYRPVDDSTEDIRDCEDETLYFKFTNGASQVWIEPESYDGDCVIIGKWSSDTKDKDEEHRKSSINLSTRKNNDPTKKSPFRSYEDLKAVLDYFKSNEQYDYWLMGWLCTTIGRRIEDVISLRWSDLFKSNNTFQYKLEKFKEKKTQKVVGAILNECAHTIIKEYLDITGISVNDVYHNRIFIDDNKDFKKAYKNKYEAFRKALGKSVSAAGITYPIGTHSFRKWYANTIYKLHPQDPDTLEILRHLFGHSDIETTLMYIEAFDDKKDKYISDYSEFMLNKMNGIDVEINNSPVVSFKSEDFRSLLSQLCDKAKSGIDKFDAINEIMGLVEKCML